MRGTELQLPPNTAISNVIDWRNPVATGLQDVLPGLDALQEACLTGNIPFRRYDTTGNFGVDTARLQQALGDAATPEGDVLFCVASGDGGLNNVLNSAVELATAHANQEPWLDLSRIIWLPLSAGYKADVATMLLGRYARRPLAALRRGRVTDVRPLRATYQPETPDAQNQPFTRLAWYAISAGPSAETMQEVNTGKSGKQKEHPNPMVSIQQLSRETSAVLRAIQTATHKQGAAAIHNPHSKVSDIFIANGDQAVGGLWRFPSRLDVPGFSCNVIAESTDTMTIAARFALRGAPGFLNTVHHGPDASVPIYLQSPVYVQMDGEHQLIGPGILTVSVAELTLRCLTTRRPQPR